LANAAAEARREPSRARRVKFEPAVDRGALIARLRDEYAIAATHLTFVPVGFVAVCYVVDCDAGDRYFLKLWPDTHASQVSIARLPISLPLTRALYDRGLYRLVPYPIFTRCGELSSTFGSMPLALFPFFVGASPPDWPDLSTDLRDKLARTVAAIHRATPALADVLPPRETFELPFENELRRALDATERIGPSERRGRVLLRDVVRGRRDEILAQLARLHLVQAHVRRLNGPLVLCHTDLGGDNHIVTDDGPLVVLDWDTASLAPPEFDLWSAVGDGFEPFLEVYRGAGGAAPLFLDHFAFCLLRRYVEDMAARLFLILSENLTDDEDREALEGMERWGFARWATLDGTLSGIEDVLRKRV
jgi:hypothetical protein